MRQTEQSVCFSQQYDYILQMKTQRRSTLSRLSNSASFNRCSFTHSFRKCAHRFGETGEQDKPVSALKQLTILHLLFKAESWCLRASSSEKPRLLYSKMSRVSSCAPASQHYKHLWSCPKASEEFSSPGLGDMSTSPCLAPALISNIICHSQAALLEGHSRGWSTDPQL